MATGLINTHAPFVQSVVVSGNTDSDGDIGIPVTTAAHSIIGAVVERPTTGSPLYFCVPTGKSGDNYIMKIFDDSFAKAANKSVTVRIDYIHIG